MRVRGAQLPPCQEAVEVADQGWHPKDSEIIAAELCTHESLWGGRKNGRAGKTCDMLGLLGSCAGEISLHSKLVQGSARAEYLS